MSTDPCLAQLADGDRLLIVEAAPIPAPAHAKHPGNHLLVNCHYSAKVYEQSRERQLADARADTLAVLRIVVAHRLVVDVVSVCVSFFVVLGPRSPRRRLYRYSIFTASLPADAAAIDASCFAPSNEAIQSSQVEEIADLLQREKSHSSAENGIISSKVWPEERQLA